MSAILAELGLAEADLGALARDEVERRAAPALVAAREQDHRADPTPGRGRALGGGERQRAARRRRVAAWVVLGPPP